MRYDSAVCKEAVSRFLRVAVAATLRVRTQGRVRHGVRCSLAAVLLVALGGGAESGPEEGVGVEALVQECDGCHGEGGRSADPEVPSIGGFSDYAIIDLLESYRTRFREGGRARRPDGTETTMNEIADALTDAEVEAVAAHYAQQPWRPQKQAFDVALARRGERVHARKCGKCHLQGGRLPESDLAITAGQWRPYLAAQFRAFDDGRRRMAPKMRKRYESLSAGDKEAILELYVSAGNY